MKPLLIIMLICLSVGCSPSSKKISTIVYKGSDGTVSWDTSNSKKLYLKVDEYWTTLTVKYKSGSIEEIHLKTDDVIRYTTGN